MMGMPNYLRRQADNCLWIARTGFDLATAERLRHMAADLRAKADELDCANRAGMEAHMMAGKAGSQGAHDSRPGESTKDGS